MKSVKCTLTSKNQITIPVKFVRNMHLQKNRQLQVRQRGNELILTPVPPLSTALKPVWQETAAQIKKPLSDAELKDSIRAIGSRG